MVALLNPVLDALAVVDEDVEEAVHEENGIFLDTVAVQEDRLAVHLQIVGRERRLYHQ